MKPEQAWQEMIDAGIVSLYSGVPGRIDPAPWLVKVKSLIDNAQEEYDQETHDLKIESIKCDLECGDLG